MDGAQADLTEELLRAICRIPSGSAALTPDLAADLRAVPVLAARASSAAGLELQHAAVLVAAVLGCMPQHQLMHLPFGYEGPGVRSAGWVDEETLQTVTKQIVGLAWPERPADVTAAAVDAAVGDALRLAFLERRKYDAWRPGMESGSGWRFAVAATPYGAQVARRHARDPVPPPPENRLKSAPEARRAVIAPAAASSSYLYADAGTPSVLDEASAFFRADDEEVAIAICRLIKRKVAPGEDGVRFFAKPAADVRLDEQLLLDEALERLAAEGERRDTAKHPPPPPMEGDPPDRTAYYLQARDWAERIDHRRHARPRPDAGPGPAPAGGGTPPRPASAAKLRQDPIRVWLAAETMRSICLRLLVNAAMVRADKDAEYDDRDVMNRDARLAESNGYLVASVARQLGLDVRPMIRVLRDDRLWEYPVEDGDPAVFRKAGDLAEQVSVEARMWCAEAGLDPEEWLERNAAEALKVGDPPSKKEKGSPTAAAGEPGAAKRTAVTPVPALPFTVDESDFSVTLDGHTKKFSGRSQQLFALLLRISRRPGHRVDFDALRQVADVWDGAAVEDGSIKGAVGRLRRKLEAAGLHPIARAIKTGTFNKRQFVVFDPDRFASKSN